MFFCMPIHGTKLISGDGEVICILILTSGIHILSRKVDVKCHKSCIKIANQKVWKSVSSSDFINTSMCMCVRGGGGAFKFQEIYVVFLFI